MVNVMERARAFFREHPVTTERRVNQYLTEHLPRLARDFKLATESDSAGVDGRIKKNETAVDELEAWQSDVTVKMDDLRKRVTRLEVRQG